MKNARFKALSAFSLILALMLSACASSSNDASYPDGSYDVAVSPPMSPEPGLAPEFYGNGSDSVSDRGGYSQAPFPSGGSPDFEAAVIRNGYVHVTAHDTALFRNQILEASQSFGAVLVGSNLSRSAQNRVQGTLQFRMDPERISEFMLYLEDLAVSVPVSRLDETDVSLQLTDLNVRRDNLIAFETELVNLLTEIRERGGNADELVRVFEQINNVRVQVEQLDAQLLYLSDQVRFATLYVEISSAPSVSAPGDPSWSVGDSFTNAYDRFVRSIQRNMEDLFFLGLLLTPFLLSGLVLLLIIRFVLRRKRIVKEQNISDTKALDLDMPVTKTSDTENSSTFGSKPSS